MTLAPEPPAPVTLAPVTLPASPAPLPLCACAGGGAGREADDEERKHDGQEEGARLHDKLLQENNGRRKRASVRAAGRQGVAARPRMRSGEALEGRGSGRGGR
ncbi:hypothetical protein BE20_02685 [Sorangium cellulosum]|nr:hypothetical protein BE20_02685 [Sorangium cellulosum]